MIAPKQKTSKSKRDKRRSHDALQLPARSVCPQCSEPKLPHRVCRNCGTYRGREVVQIDEGPDDDGPSFSSIVSLSLPLLFVVSLLIDYRERFVTYTQSD